MDRKLKLKGGVYEAPYKGCTMHITNLSLCLFVQT